jgi:hypothetical protein
MPVSAQTRQLRLNGKDCGDSEFAHLWTHNSSKCFKYSAKQTWGNWEHRAQVAATPVHLSGDGRRSYHSGKGTGPAMLLALCPVVPKLAQFPFCHPKSMRKSAFLRKELVESRLSVKFGSKML